MCINFAKKLSNSMLLPMPVCTKQDSLYLHHGWYSNIYFRSTVSDILVEIPPVIMFPNSLLNDISISTSPPKHLLPNRGKCNSFRVFNKQMEQKSYSYIYSKSNFHLKKDQIKLERTKSLTLNTHTLIQTP